MVGFVGGFGRGGAGGLGGAAHGLPGLVGGTARSRVRINGWKRGGLPLIIVIKSGNCGSSGSTSRISVVVESGHFGSGGGHCQCTVVSSGRVLSVCG